MTVILLAVLVIALIAVGAAALNFFVFGTRNPALKNAEITIGNKTFQVELASTIIERTRGLSGREDLGDREGMLFMFDSPGNYSFWMKDMKFPIDIIWIRDDRVVGFEENALPEPEKSDFGLTQYSPSEPVDMVLEVNAGIVAEHGIQVGDVVKISL